MSIEILKQLCTTPWVSGSEYLAEDTVRALFGPLGTVQKTALGSYIINIVPPKADGAHIALDAHLDQIGLIVTHIDANGFVRVAPVGGIDRRQLPAATVTILGSEPVKGVVSVLAPHLAALSSGDDLPEIQDLYIDTGYSAQKLSTLVKEGDLVCLDSHFVNLSEDLVSGGSLDNRVSVYAQYLAAKKIKESGFNGCGVSVLLTCREEIGGQGAATGSFAGGFTHAIVVDVSFAMSYGCDETTCKYLQKGPMVGYSPILDRGMYTDLCAVAKEENIDYQTEIMNGRTGTDSDSLTTVAGGIKTAMISIPQRYMHSPCEVCSLSDIEKTADLIAAYVQKRGELL